MNELTADVKAALTAITEKLFERNSDFTFQNIMELINRIPQELYDNELLKNYFYQ